MTCVSVWQCTAAFLLLSLAGAEFSTPAWNTPQQQAASPRTLVSLQECAPRPVFMMHGLGSNSGGLTTLATWIRNAYPGIKTFQIPLYEDDASITPLAKQLPTIAKYIRDTVAQDPTSFQSGYDFVGYSQGGLLLRALVQYMPDHKVHTFISLAGPQMGVYGDHLRAEFNSFLASSGLGPIIKALTGKDLDVDELAYLGVAQTMLSAANLWNDPTRRAEFLENNVFLPLYNGLVSDGNIAQRKTNFLRLAKAVFLVGDFGPGGWDGGVQPWQTGVFGFFKDGSTTDFIAMEETPEYAGDTFGLKTLKESGRLLTKAVPQASHAAWVSDFTIVQEHILPHLGDCSFSPHADVTATSAIVSSTTTAVATTASVSSQVATSTTAPQNTSEGQVLSVLSGGMRAQVWPGTAFILLLVLVLCGAYVPL